MQYLFGKKKFIDCCTVYPLRQIWQQRPSCLRPIHCSIQGTIAVLLFSSCTPNRSRNLLFPDILPLLSLLGESLVETVVNVLTSLPFIALGIQAPRQGFFYFFFPQVAWMIFEIYLPFSIPDTIIYWGCRKNFSSTLYANSLIGVGVASSLYHCSRGEIRKYMRWADYTMIATSTVVSVI